MTSDPLPGTPAHKVLMQTAYGNHQVSQYAAAVEARTIGAQAHQPALDLPARSQDVNLFYGIPAIQSYPFDGSAWVIWDDGPGLVSPPPLADFLDANGSVVDVCGGLPCHTDVFAP